MISTDGKAEIVVSTGGDAEIVVSTGGEAEVERPLYFVHCCLRPRDIADRRRLSPPNALQPVPLSNMSIATGTGDNGSTALIGGLRVSKADLRVEAYGTVDELNTFLGVARSQCKDPELRNRTEAIQRTLFRVGAALSRPSGHGRAEPDVTAADVGELTAQIHTIEAVDGLLSDWSLPGAHTESASFEVARTVCRRAERCAVRLQAADAALPTEPLIYLNRLSDLLWLYGRLLEHHAGIDGRLRGEGKAGPNWSRAW